MGNGREKSKGKEERRNKMLYVGVNPLLHYSGTAKLAHYLIERFIKRYDVDVTGWGCEEKEQKEYLCPILSCSQDKWWETIKTSNPDVIFLSHDIFRFPIIAEVKRSLRGARVVGYFPIDCDGISVRWIKILESCDAIIVPSDFARRAIESRYTKKPVFVVPEGVDENIFKCPDKKKVKAFIDSKTQSLPGVNKLYFQNKFVIFLPGINQSKKNFSSALDMFHIFSRGKDDVLLVLLVHNMVQMFFGEELVAELDFADLFPWKESKNKFVVMDEAITDEQVAMLYQASDALLFPSIGEGFGLPVVEAMASKAIPIITGYSAMIEIPSKYFSLPYVPNKALFNANRAVVDVYKGARVLEEAYRIWKYFPDIWDRMVKENATKASLLTWDRCAGNIMRVVDSVLAGDSLLSIEVKRL